MHNIPSQCKCCVNFSVDESLCKIYEQLPGEYGREEIAECPSFIERGTKSADDLSLLIKYLEEDQNALLEQSIAQAVDNILQDYEVKYKVMIVGIARRKIKSIIRMVDIVDAIIDKLGDVDTLTDMNTSQAIRLLSELNHSMNNDLTFVMKLVNPETQLRDLQMLIDNRSINVVGASPTTEMKSEEILKLTGASRDKVRDAFDALLLQIKSDDTIEVAEVLGEEGE